MSIIQWNCRGITSSAEELKSLFRESEVKIMCLQETKLGNKPYNPGLNYSFHRSPQLLGERAQGELASLFTNPSISLQSSSTLYFRHVQFRSIWIERLLCVPYIWNLN